MNEITPPNVIKALEKIDLVQADLKNVLVNRDEIIKLSIICLIAHENIILLGPPGTAKSLLARELCERISGAKLFERLLTKFTDESELFVSGKSIKTTEGETVNNVKENKVTFEKDTKGMLPHRDIAFLDEIFKANSAILNAMLTLINEKIYFTNDGPVPSDLITVIGASNERPDLNEGLEALYDRFLVRYYVDYLDKDGTEKMLRFKSKTDKNKIPKIKKTELNILHEYLENIHISDEVYDKISGLREELEVKAESDNIYSSMKPSDRRLKNSLKLLKAHALLRRSNIVEIEDYSEIYTYILWDTTPGKMSAPSKEDTKKVKEFLGKKDSFEIKELKEMESKRQEEEDYIKGLMNSLWTDLKKNNINEKTFLHFCQEATEVISRVETYKRNIEEKLENKTLNNNDRAILNSYKEKWSKYITKLTEECFEFEDSFRLRNMKSLKKEKTDGKR